MRPALIFVRSALVAGLMLSCGVPPTDGQMLGQTLTPVDEGPRNRSFEVFRHQLVKAIQKRDKAMLLSMLGPKVRTFWDGNDTSAEFRSAWKLDDVRTPLWDILERITSLGGSFIGEKTFCAPYTYSLLAGKDIEQDLAAIVGARVALRLLPRGDSKVVTFLSNDLVRANYAESVKGPPSVAQLMVDYPLLSGSRSSSAMGSGDT